MDADQLTPLNPNYVKLMRVTALILSVPLVIAGFVLEVAGPLFPGVAIVPTLIIAVVLILRVPLRRYHARGYRLADERLQVVRGILFKSDTVVPFGRVQHIDVNQGPLERFYDLATLTLHTAGSHNASVLLPGLAHEDALAMRETIREAIKRDTV